MTFASSFKLSGQMIVFTPRAFFRTREAWLFANSYAVANRANQLLGYRCHHGLSCISKYTVSKGFLGSMDWSKKGKAVAPVWRQISTQSESNQECSSMDVVAKPENIVSVGQGEQDHIVSIVRAVADSSISSSSLQTKEEAEGTVISHGTTCHNDGRKDDEDVILVAATTYAAQNISGIKHADNSSGVSTKRHSLSVEVGRSVMRFIKGKDGSTQKSIEDMGVKILFPSLKKGDTIVIEGSSEDVITKASQEIETIIHEAVKSPSFGYSHFISLPLAIHPDLVEKVTEFQSKILGSAPDEVDGTVADNSIAIGEDSKEKVDRSDKDSGNAVKLRIGDDPNHVRVDLKNIPTVSYAPKAAKSSMIDDPRIDKSLFLKPQRLHLTTLMLKLWNKERVHAAAEVLQGVSSAVNEVLDNRPVFVRLKGLDLMRGSRARAQVLYAPVEEIGNEGRLLRACQIITDAYVKAGLVLEKDAHQKLKLHATLMNTSFRRGKTKQPRNDSFDARFIFQQFGTEQWGDYHLREAHLSQRFVYDDNGFYHCCASIPLPENSEVQNTRTSEAELLEKPIAESA